MWSNPHAREREKMSAAETIMYFTRKHLKSRALGAVNMIVSEPIGLERRVVVALLGLLWSRASQIG